MRNQFFAMCCGLLIIAAAHADGATDTLAAREAAAERYLATVDTQALFQNILEASASTLPEERRAQVADMWKHVRIDYIEDLQRTAMVKTFTADELNAMADFYGSPAGKSATAKLGFYMRDVMPLLMAEMRRAVEEWVAEKKAALKPPSGT